MKVIIFLGDGDGGARCVAGVFARRGGNATRNKTMGTGLRPSHAPDVRKSLTFGRAVSLATSTLVRLRTQNFIAHNHKYFVMCAGGRTALEVLHPQVASRSMRRSLLSMQVRDICG